MDPDSGYYVKGILLKEASSLWIFSAVCVPFPFHQWRTHSQLLAEHTSLQMSNGLHNNTTMETWSGCDKRFRWSILGGARENPNQLHAFLLVMDDDDGSKPWIHSKTHQEQGDFSNGCLFPRVPNIIWFYAYNNKYSILILIPHRMKTNLIEFKVSVSVGVSQRTLTNRRTDRLHWGVHPSHTLAIPLGTSVWVRRRLSSALWSSESRYAVHCSAI